MAGETPANPAALLTRSLRESFKDLVAVLLAEVHFAFVDQLLKVRAHRHLGGLHQLLPHLRSVYATGELAGRPAATPDLGQNLGFAFQPVRSVLIDFPRGVSDRIPVTRKQHLRLERCDPVERAEVIGHVSLRVGDHRAPAPEHQVTGEEGAVVGQPEAEVVRTMTRRVKGDNVELARTDHVAVTQVGIPLDRRVMGSREAICQRKVVRMGMRDEHYADSCACELSVDSRQVAVVIRARVDDDRNRAGVEDPGVCARPGVRPRVGRHDARNESHGWVSSGDFGINAGDAREGRCRRCWVGTCRASRRGACRR